jgi:hypothetical protein
MTDIALIALLDALLPGDAETPPLPAFSQAGIDPALFEAAAQPLLAVLDQKALVYGTAADRVAMLRTLEQSAPEAFRSFLWLALAAYYQGPVVQAALGWRHAPPQPGGHRLSGNDDDAWQLLDKVRRRNALWRGG